MINRMLWFDDSSERTLQQKVERAAAHYEEKYGVKPNVCYVHPSALYTTVIYVGEIKITGTHQVLPNHLWMGVR